MSLVRTGLGCPVSESSCSVGIGSVAPTNCPRLEWMLWYRKEGVDRLEKQFL